MYKDKLDGHITQEFFDRQAANLGKEQDGLLRKIQEIQEATPAPIDQAIDMLRLTSGEQAVPPAKRRRATSLAAERGGKGRLDGWQVADKSVRTV